MKKLFRKLVRPILELQARRLVRRKKLRIVAVGGSVGKSSTKLAIAAVLKRKFRVLVHPGNYNADLSVPLALFDLDVPSSLLNPLAWWWRIARMEKAIWSRCPYDVVVIELGTDHPGEIPHFMKYLHPEIGVVTAVAPEHMEYFSKLDAVAVEEMALAAGSRTALVGDVDEKYVKFYAKSHERMLRYGLGEDMDFGIVLERTDPIDGSIGAMYEAGKLVVGDANLALFGRHSAKAAAAAFAVGRLLEMTVAELEAGLADIRPMHGRMNPIAGMNGSTIIDDTYNSSPEAASAALSALIHADGSGRRIAIMGSMNELGRNSPKYHREVGAQCIGLDMLVTVGEMANRHLGPAAVAAGLDSARWYAASSPYDAGEYLRMALRDGDLVLAKGSQNGVFAEETVRMILADTRDAELLVRQSPYWLGIKKRQFEAREVAPEPLKVKRVIQQSLTRKLGEERALKACVPCCFYMMASAEGYVPRKLSLAGFVGDMDWGGAHDDRGWIRPKLTADLRQRYGWPIVSWQLSGPDNPSSKDMAAMREAGYISSPREQGFFTSQIVGRDVEEIVRAGHAVIVSVKPGFGGNRDSHAVVVTEWTDEDVYFVDPDRRNHHHAMSPARFRSFINPVGGGSVILPIER